MRYQVETALLENGRFLRSATKLQVSFFIRGRHAKQQFSSSADVEEGGHEKEQKWKATTLLVLVQTSDSPL